MPDPRLDKLAATLIHYSAGVKKGDLVRIGGEVGALHLFNLLYEHCLRAGAHPFLQILSDDAEDALLRLGTDEQIRFENPLTQFMVENINVYIGIRAPANTRSRTNVPPEKQALASQARKKVLKTLMTRAAEKKMRWAGTQFPTHAAAQEAEMSLHDYENFVYSACLLDQPDPVAAWRALSEKQQRLVDYLMTKKEIRILIPPRNGGPATDLTLATEGRTWINCDGHVNFPDGEVFTAPLENATRGTIRYSFPAVYSGRECHDITLTFKDGKVVDASASKGQDFLLKTIDQDAGARIFGELAIGTNFGIRQYTKNILFDEKIGGTIHTALGAAYPDSGGKNESALHWDLVADLRGPGAKVLADNEPILVEGRFTRPEWPNP